MQHYLDAYTVFLKVEHGLSENTLKNYLADVRDFLQFAERELEHWSFVEFDSEFIRSYLAASQEARKLSPYTLARRISGLRLYFEFLHTEGLLPKNPMQLIEG
ncbi:MAG: site-specific integrase, partial [Bacteroidota bacterium]